MIGYWFPDKTNDHQSQEPDTNAEFKVLFRSNGGPNFWGAFRGLAATFGLTVNRATKVESDVSQKKTKRRQHYTCVIGFWL